MKLKNRRLLIIAIVLVVYNVLVFVLPFQRNAVFWIAFAFSDAAILAQVAADWIAFRDADNLRKVFLGMPVIKLSLICLGILLAVCFILMGLDSFLPIPRWVAIVPNILIFGFAAIAVILADWAREKIEQIDTQTVIDTMFMQSFRTEIKSLVRRVTDADLKAKLEKISETAAYADPVSNEYLAEMESTIGQKLGALKQAIQDGGADGIAIADELALLLAERDEKCRLFKRQQYQTKGTPQP